jgi:phosphate transport system substrate-binding protein
VSTTTGCTNGTITFTVPVTAITNADLFTKTDLQTLFGTGMPVTEPPAGTTGSTVYWPANGAVTQPAGSTVVDLYVPQAGSGTLSFWATQMGFTAASPPAWDHQTILAGPAVGVAVEEHDGTAYASDPNGLGPFSIAQWIAQSNGFNDRRHTAILHMINGVAPITGTSLNTAFPIVREVYNVMPYDEVVNTGDGNFNAQMAGLFVGTTSLLCGSVLTIKQYGFGTLPSSSTPDACGATTTGLRVQETNTGPG